MKKVYYIIISALAIILAVPMTIVIIAFEDALVYAVRVRKYFDND